MLTPIILSGGSGTRLWPLSRKAYPKQFLDLYGERPLFQQAVLRTQQLADCEPPVVICNEDHRFLVLEQLQACGITGTDVLLEPVARNTAPAIACAALHTLQKNPDSVLLVMPSDHVVRDTEEFAACVERGLPATREYLITFGIQPDRPETGYGYIRKAGAIGGIPGFPVKAFVEKPDSGRARQFLDSGEYLWNSGMFLFRADQYLAALESFRPDILSAATAAHEKSARDYQFIRLDKESFRDCPAESIDYAVMEHTDRALTIPMDVGWHDLGAWDALCELNEKDTDGNVIQGDVLTRDAHNNFIHSSKRLVSAVGINNCIIVETADAVLVADQGHVQDVRSIADTLQQEQREEATFHACVYRPWGSFETVDESPGFKVKRLVIKPGGCLSLQKHSKRAEHWVVVRGEATVTRGEEVFKLREDESTYIPMGTRHRLENLTDKPLEIVEVQTGEYLGEDDIERFDDVYGRKN